MSIVDDRNYHRCGKMMCHRLDCLDCYPTMAPIMRKTDMDKRSKDYKEYVDALGTQVAGDHYTEMGIQPIEVCFKRHGYAGVKIALQLKVDKYLSRKKDDELEQLNKAIHCIELMKEFYEKENG